MAKVNETGHAVNVDNLLVLISICTGYGNTYNPSKSSITLTALNALHTNSRAALQEVNNNIVNYGNAINARRVLYDGIKPLATRLVNALQATDAPKAMIDDAKGFNRKIQGVRAQKIDANTAPDAKNVSSSQQSFTQMVEHVSKLVALLASEPSYNPNETELKITTLNAFVANLYAANLSVTNAYTSITNSRIARNELLYNPTTGIHNFSLEVKNYVKSLFGATSPQYKQISGLKFTNPSKI